VLRGSRKLRGRLAIVHVAPAADSESRLGVALTRRLVPSAVDRNFVKRIVREAFRCHAVKGSGMDCVVMLRERFTREHAAEVLAEICRHLDQIAGRVE